jgi:dolichyl-phosphate-mannose-protein mannosyltransferase
MAQPETPEEQSNGPVRSRVGPSPVVLAAVAVLLVGTALRVWFAVRGAESPMIDENEVVEQAVAFMGGELKMHFLKYGPLAMYVLAGIYHVAALLHGESTLDYASHVFFEGTEHYAIARVYTVGWLSVLALLAFLSFRRRLGPAPALLACALLAFPFIEILGQGARIDYQQGACQGIALLALGEVAARPRLRYWLAAGVFAGFAVATKPLPGLLIGPCFLVASYAAAGTRADGSRRPPLARLGAALLAPGMWLAGLAVAGCAVLGNPAMLDIGQFVQSQREAVELHSGNKLQARASISDSFLRLQLPYLLVVAAAFVLVALRRDISGLNIALFFVVYLAAFVGRQGRTYFFIAPAAASCLLVAHAWAALEALVLPRLRQLRSLREPGRLAWAAGLVALLSLQGPLRALWSQRLAPNPATVTGAWLKEHAPSGTPIFYVGMRASGPRIVATDRKLQASWGDHFGYGRQNYRFLKQAFRHAHAEYRKSGKPIYPLVVHDDKPYPRKDNKMPRWLTDNLVARARKDKQRFIVVAGYRENDVRELGYRWFDQAVLEIEARHIAIFSVPDPPPVTAPASDAR